MKIGIMGGTFNPIHNAHIAMAQSFTHSIGLDKCLIVPAAVSPFKVGEAPTISDELRLKMIQSAIADTHFLELCKYEVEKGGISYSIDTIKYIRNKYLDSDLFLLIGTDQALKFNKWKDYQKIMKSATICIVKRPDMNESNDIGKIEKIFEDADNKPIWIDAPIINITSTIIRNMIEANEDITELVHNSVANIIKVNRLYFPIRDNSQ